MATKNTRTRFTHASALALHVEANKSDPFAAKRMAMALRKHPGFSPKDVGEESKRLIASRAARIERTGYGCWMTPEQIVALSTLRDGLKPRAKRKPTRKPREVLAVYPQQGRVAA